MRTRFAMWATAAGLTVCSLPFSAPTFADLPLSVVTSPDADKGANREAIKKHVAEQVEKLVSEDPAVRTSGRDGLVSRVTQTAHPVFVDFYCSEINIQIRPALADAKLESRLNAAIVLARLAPADRAAKLSESVITVLGDKQEPVKLWGMKAAAQLLPSSITVQSLNNPLLAKVSEVAQSAAGSTLIVEAYDGLTLTTHSSEVIALRDRYSNADWERLIKVVMPEFRKLWATRLDQYIEGKVIEPMAEQIPTNFVSPLRSWTAMGKDQQVVVMQMLLNQLSLAGELAGDALEAKPAYIRVIQRTAGAIQVIAQHENNRALGDVASAIGKLPDTAAAATIEGAIAPMQKAIIAVPKFASIKPAPKVKR
ncbi:MAG TPA: hypothetical protein PLD59_11285 [Tepidisphaeraceae bacterium]|nr:hypothetical protein [Tepidisphaeraceae bacterium]